ncbi:MAG: HD domain-containing protein [Bacteroidales bacterium]|nr:HD domain-containing protein [Bacteroidales bacterium]
MVNAELKAYIECEILPRYHHFDSAHQLDHILTVMAQSMELAHHYHELNPDMVYTIAAYHDTGIVEGRERHHLVSGRIMRQDPELPQWFTPDQIETMAQAVEDHRASATSQPRSLYGKLVAEADRDIQPLNIIRRTVQYGLSHYPQLDKGGHWQRTLQHLGEKYGRNGYLKFYIPESRNRAQMERLWQLMEDPTLLRETFEKIYQQECSPNKHNN